MIDKVVQAVSSLFNKSAATAEPQQRAVLSPEERFDKLLKSIMETVLTDAEKKLPDRMRFPPIGCGMVIPDTEYAATVSVEYSETDYNKRRVCVRVFERNSDKKLLNLFPEMNNQEIKAYLASEQAFAEIKASINELFTKAVDNEE